MRFNKVWEQRTKDELRPPLDIDTVAGCQHIWNLIPLENVDYFAPQQFIVG